ncbi:MarR family transcriptional regulator [beta proteobacterium AAP121]|nr:MarR family transcriptional regulator [beta proteobacterium AAP65]KPG00890.1 MarR family transcriptional regulator [beta proteobacterium AAP121]
MDTPNSSPQHEAPAAPRLPAVTERFVLHWGEMGSRWGVNRTMSQIHALLFVTGRPMNADELCEQLGVARSNVSNSLRELQGWGLVKVVHLLGDRRDHFETSGDVWDLLRTIVRGRKQREFDPTIVALRECLAHPELARESAVSRQRINETLVLMETTSVWVDEMLRLPPETLVKIMKLGVKIQSLLRGGAKP